jgi:hypothetical protein
VARAMRSTATKGSRLGRKHVANDDAHRQSQSLAGEERHRRIAEAAYLIAERRGFQGGSALEDWLTAEAHINSLDVATTPAARDQGQATSRTPLPAEGPDHERARSSL